MTINSETKFDKCLVIGGAGMLGYEIVKLLLKEGKKVRILDIVPVHNEKIDEHIGDIRNKKDLEKACEDIEIVFQTAAAVWNPGVPKKIFDEINIDGNKNVIDTCIKYGIKKLVYTSTMDVVVDGRKPIVDGDETLAYPSKMPKDPYCRTKIIAEKLVLQSNNEALLTCALRPVGMYGPRDKYHLANIIIAAKSRANIKLGNGSARFSHVYSENAAYAHVLAAKNLYPGSLVAGSAYFISDHYPAKNLFTFMEPFLEGLGLEPPKKSIPYVIAYILASINQKINPDSNFNTFSVIQTCIDHTFVYDKATRDFGYIPIISKQEAFGKTLNWFKENSL